jgi:uncharacterized protein (UPF0276 family)
MSLGSAHPLDMDHLARLKVLIEAVDPLLVSEHLCWTGVDGQNLHDLLPLPYTEEAVRHVASRIAQAQEFLGRRILVENLSSYLSFSHSTMAEWEFVAAVAKAADCGILLDVNNIHVSARNHHFDPMAYVRGIPAERVGEIHVAGHADMGAYLLDTHSEPVAPEVWDLYGRTLEHLGGPRPTLLERDGSIPDLAVLLDEVAIAGRIMDRNWRSRAIHD